MGKLFVRFFKKKCECIAASTLYNLKNTPIEKHLLSLFLSQIYGKVSSFTRRENTVEEQYRFCGTGSFLHDFF